MWWNTETGSFISECVRPAGGAQSPSHGQKEESCSASGDPKPPGCLSGPGTPPELPLRWTKTPACPSRPSSVKHKHVCKKRPKNQRSKQPVTCDCADCALWSMSSYFSVLFRSSEDVWRIAHVSKLLSIWRTRTTIVVLTLLLRLSVCQLFEVTLSKKSIL